MQNQERENLVKQLKNRQYIKTKTVEQAFLNTPRELFVPNEIKIQAYIDTPLHIGCSQTISAPHMVAIMVEALDLHRDQTVLEIGGGSGYHAAVVSHIIGEKGHVYTVERHTQLAHFAEKNLKNANINNVTVHIGDGSKGLEDFAPYDRIYVTCAAPDIPPPLIEQLKDPGKLLVPIGEMTCSLILLKKNTKTIKTNDLGGCVFVPLIGKYGH